MGDDDVGLRPMIASATAALACARWLDVGLPAGPDLSDMADLANYAFPLATRLRSEHLVSVWRTKRIADTSRVVVAPPKEVPSPQTTLTVRTTASSQTQAYKEQVRAAVANARELPGDGVQLQIAFVVGPLRNWLSL